HSHILYPLRLVCYDPTGLPNCICYHLLTILMRTTSAKVHISPLYLMGHVRDRGPNYKTQVVAFIVHVPVTPDKIRGSGTFFFVANSVAVQPLLDVPRPI